MKSDGAVDHSTVTKWSKKFHSSCMYLDNQARSGRPKTVDSKVLLQANEVNPASSILRVSGELSISQSRVVYYLHSFSKNIDSSLYY